MSVHVGGRLARRLAAVDMQSAPTAFLGLLPVMARAMKAMRNRLMLLLPQTVSAQQGLDNSVESEH